MKSRTILAWMFAVIIFPVAVHADGKRLPTPEDLAKAFKNQVRSADIIVVGSLSEIQSKRFEIVFRGKDGRSQTNSFDSGILQVQRVLKGEASKSSLVVAFRSKSLGLNYYGGTQNASRIWLLHAAHEPVAGFNILSAPSFLIEDESKIVEALAGKE